MDETTAPASQTTSEQTDDPASAPRVIRLTVRRRTGPTVRDGYGYDRAPH